MSKKNTAASYTREGLKVSPGVLRIADALAPKLTIGEGGVINPVDKDVFETLLPEGLTLADIKRVDNFKSDLISGAALAVGETAIAAFQKDKNLRAVSFTMGVNKDKLQLQIDRDRTFPNRMGGEGAPDIVKYAGANARYVVSASGNRGDFGRVKSHLGEMGRSIFGG